MSSPAVPVNRTLVGVLAAGCGVLGALSWVLSGANTGNLWPGAFLRVGTVLGAFWLALPSRNREAAWARVPIWQVLGVMLALLVIVRLRVPFRFLIPAGLIFGVAWLLLRRRPPKRPRARY